MEDSFAIVLWDDMREEQFYYSAPYVNTPYRASTLLEEAVYEDPQDLSAALQKSFLVLLNMHVPIQEHFRPMHVHNSEGHIQDDWALSDLAFYLLLLNGDVHKSAVAEAQAFAIRHIYNRLS
jgi:hypothetical protein